MINGLLFLSLVATSSSNLSLYKPFLNLDDSSACTGGVFENSNQINLFSPTCTPNQEADCLWNIMAVTLSNNQTASKQFNQLIDKITRFCSNPSLYFMNFNKFNTINRTCSLEKRNSTKDFYSSQSDQYPMTSNDTFDSDNAAHVIDNMTSCVINYQYLSDRVGGVVYVYIDLPCNDSCLSALLLNYQAHFVDSVIRLRYSVYIYYPEGLLCYDSIFAQCIASTSYCHLVHGLPSTQDDNFLCREYIKPNDVSSFEIGFSMGISLFLLLVIIIINVTLICQKQNRVQEAYNRLREKHFPNATNDYLFREKKTDKWEIFPGNLEVFVNDILGTGAFATVYMGKLTGRRPVDEIVKAIQLKSDTTDQVAVKRPPHHADHSAKHDFREEINFMKKLGYHTHILGMIGCVTTLDPPMIVMQYCEQGDLLGFLHKNKETFSVEEGPTRAKELLSISWQICDGLCYLKSVELIHRDLAARNVLLTADLTAKVRAFLTKVPYQISDFGLCRQGKVTDANSIYISKGGRLPVKWMAPESLKNYIFSFSTDLWAYGVVLWETFSLGELPFPRINGGAMYDILEVGERLPKLPLIPEDIYQIMSQCWKWNPEERLTIEELREKLMEILANSSAYYGYLSRDMLEDQSQELVDISDLLSSSSIFDEVTLTRF